MSTRFLRYIANKIRYFRFFCFSFVGINQKKIININFHLRNLTEKKTQSIWTVFYVENVRTRTETNLLIIPDNWSKDKKKAKTCYANGQICVKTHVSQLEGIYSLIAEDSKGRTNCKVVITK